MEPNAVTAPDVPPSWTDTQEVPAAQPHPQEDKIAKDMLEAFDELASVGGNVAATPAVEAASAEAPSPSKRVTGKQSIHPLSTATLLCCKCKLDKPNDSAGGGGGGSSAYFVCKTCNTKRSTLSQLFGKWPVDHFTTLPEEQQIAFWRTGTKGKQQIQEALAEAVTEHRETVYKTTVGGTYLPLSVLDKQGFDTSLVETQCTDVEDHPLLGKTYNLNLKETTRDDIRKQVWDDLFDIKPKSPKKKKGKKSKGGKKSSSDSDSSSSSTSSKKPTQAEQRKAACLKRKAEAAEAKEEAKQQRIAAVAALKAQKEADKVAIQEAKEKQKEALEAQNSYSSLTAAHMTLDNMCVLIPREMRECPEHAAAKEKLVEGEELIAKCLDAMKDKTPAPADEIKAYLTSVKSSQMAMKKLKPKGSERRR